jgi:hypothetical protein
MSLSIFVGDGGIELSRAKKDKLFTVRNVS